MTDTESKVRAHIHRVQSEMMKLINVLHSRVEHHDASKVLKGIEKDGWEHMDAEKCYEYGTPQYFDKINRYNWVLNMHYKNNSHHPEHYDCDISKMDLIDLTEMLCDWVSYKDGSLSYLDAIEIIDQQSKRFGLSPELTEILLNTLKRFLMTSSFVPSEKHDKDLSDDLKRIEEVLNKNSTEDDLLNIDVCPSMDDLNYFESMIEK